MSDTHRGCCLCACVQLQLRFPVTHTWACLQTPPLLHPTHPPLLLLFLLLSSNILSTSTPVSHIFNLFPDVSSSRPLSSPLLSSPLISSPLWQQSPLHFHLLSCVLAAGESSHHLLLLYLPGVVRDKPDKQLLCRLQTNYRRTAFPVELQLGHLSSLPPSVSRVHIVITHGVTVEMSAGSMCSKSVSTTSLLSTRNSQEN